MTQSLNTVHLWVSELVSIYSKREILWWWLSEILIYWYKRLLMRVILFLYFSCRNIWYVLRSAAYVILSFWSSEQCLLWVPSHGVCFKSNQRVWLVISTSMPHCYMDGDIYLIRFIFVLKLHINVMSECGYIYQDAGIYGSQKISKFWSWYSM